MNKIETKSPCCNREIVRDGVSRDCICTGCGAVLNDFVSSNNPAQIDLLDAIGVELMAQECASSFEPLKKIVLESTSQERKPYLIAENRRNVVFCEITNKQNGD